MSFSVLVIDDEKSFRVIAEEALSREGYRVRTAASGSAGARAWRDEPADVVVLDRNLPDIDGVELLATLSREAQDRGVDTLFLVATAYADVENAVQALRQGAEDYLTKPIQLPDLVVKIRKALETRRLRNRVRAFQRGGQPQLDALLVTDSAAMRDVLERARLVAESPSTSVLIVDLNCAALSEGLLESELFGHERGAFTDAKTSKRGLLEVADGGTLFLDEIGELGPGLQTKLLRALETTTFRRVGGTRDLAADVRIIAATNRDLQDEVRAGRFRLDLFHRLDVFHLTVPPLRQRREDIPALARFLLARIGQRLLKPSPGLTPEAERTLTSYSYPGNVRELRNVLERAAILEQGQLITPSSLLLGDARPRPAGGGPEPFFSVPLSEEGRPPTLAELERLYIERLLSLAEGNRTQVARLLDVSYPTVAKKIADFGIKLPD